MMLAWKEMTRARGRFAAITGAIALVTFLIVTISALADGLYYGATGAVRATTAQAYAFSSDAEGSLIRSQLPRSSVEELQGVEGVEQAAGVGVLLTVAAFSDGTDADVAVFGIDATGPGAPVDVVQGQLPAAGVLNQAAVDQALSWPSGVEESLTIGTNRLQVIGETRDSQYQLQPTVWTSVDEWERLRAQVRPETAGGPPVVNAVALTLAPGVSPEDLTRLPVGISVLSAEQTGLAIPGVEQQNSTLDAIIYTTLAVAALVVALFFALIVLEKRELYAALKALGAGGGRLARSVVVQALLTSVVGVVLGVAVAWAAGLVLPGQIPTLYRLPTTAETAVLIVAAGLLGGLVSLRRVVRIDPATALGGS